MTKILDSGTPNQQYEFYLMDSVIFTSILEMLWNAFKSADKQFNTLFLDIFMIHFENSFLY